MMINGRLLLLVLATGLFIRVWTDNERGRHSTLPPVRSDAGSSNLTPRHPRVLRDGSMATVSSIALVRAGSAAEITWTEATCPIPLPHALAGGTYRVVDDAGSVARLEVAQSARPRSVGDIAEPDFLVSCSAGRRWYFIRLKAPANASPMAISPPALPIGAGRPTSDRAPLANRKFDFTGYMSQDVR